MGIYVISLNNLIFKRANFVGIKNKWKEIGIKCCFNYCINTNKAIGNCIKGYGFGNIINDENIKYINCLKKKGVFNKVMKIYAENSFKKPKDCLNYSLYYFEIKCIFEVDLNDYRSMSIGLKNCTSDWIRFSAKYATIYNDKDEEFKLSSFTWNDNDIFGCGLVYPPTNKMNYKFPYVFFTQNGQQIGKGNLLKENTDSYKPYVALTCYSIEANFGNDLETKPFIYDISKHLILKEFY
ncbi:unnamed protein product [Meloidogyne enterolobii]|uniref:Uncharacterized protein n=1 Tax=Meloidogyne enterolobii TaxID=390850 RepID=A0ACB0YLS8_MELEN